MKKTFLGLSLAFLIIASCDKKVPDEVKNENTDISSSADTESQRTNTYAIITSIATTNKQKYIDNITQQQDQLDNLWNQKTVGNIYMSSKPNEIAPSIIFFLKAKSESEVRETLDKTNFIVNGVGRYDVKPVGDLWLGMNENSMDMKSKKKSTFAVVWDFTKKFNEIPTSIMQKELDAEKQLFEQGIIENLYLSTANDDNKRTPSVFFINSDSEKDAGNILNELPIAKEKLGSYRLINVGGFLRGEKK